MSGPNGSQPTQPAQPAAAGPENLGGIAPGAGRSVHDNPLLRSRRRAATGDTSHNSADIHNRLLAIREPEGVADDGQSQPAPPLAGQPAPEPTGQQPGAPTLAPPGQAPEGVQQPELAPPEGADQQQADLVGGSSVRFTASDIAGALEMDPGEFYQRFGFNLTRGADGESQFVPLSQVKDAVQALVDSGGNLDDLNAALAAAQPTSAEVQAQHTQLDVARQQLAQQSQAVAATHRQATEQIQLAQNLVNHLRGAFVDDNLQNEDPGAWAAQNLRWNQYVEQVNQAHAEARQTAAQQAARERNQRMHAGWQWFYGRRPAWRDQGTRQSEQQAVTSFLAQTYGFSPQEMRGLDDARLLALAVDAWESHRDRSSVDLGKLRGLKPVATMQPGAAVTGAVQQQSRTGDQHQQLVDQHHQHPASRDALRARLSSYISNRQEVPNNDGPN